MNIYSTESAKKLSTCHPRLQELFTTVLQIMDHKILEGHRGQLEQDKAFDGGKSKVRWPDGKHNKIPSNAVDALPTPINWGDTKRMIYFAGIVMGVAYKLNIPIRWGHDWDGDTDLNDQSFNDLPHFELKEIPG